ncbi:MAG TPA: homoserine kinase [Chroococcales cyanobacterium]|jgi:homoserine kinase
MSVVSTVTVTVPATTANLGPGFDCIGAALTLYNQFKFTRLDLSSSGQEKETEVVRIAVTGAEADRVDTSADNLVYKAFSTFYQHLSQTPPPVQIEIELGVPLARGLGSSATAIVGGLVGANELAGKPLDTEAVMKLAIAMEGHPDNVVPALVGGCRLAATGEDVLKAWEICEIPWHSEIVPVVVIPDFELSTQQARSVLPAQISRADAIFNIAHLGLLVRGLEMGRGDWLQTALQDKLHQPYRQALIPGYDAVRSAALATGAYGMAISGAGPTLIALVNTASATTVAAAMVDAWKAQGTSAQEHVLKIDGQGAHAAIE